MHTVTPGGKVTNRLSTYRDLSPYFEHSRVARNSRASDRAQLGGALYSGYPGVMDSWQIHQFVARLNTGATK